MSEILCFLGVSGSGKTQAIKKMVQTLPGKKGGIITIGDYKDGKRQNFWVRDVVTGQEVLLAQRDLAADITQGAFGFTQQGLSFGNNCIQQALKEQVEVLFIDEIGPLELRGEGWYLSLQMIETAKINKIVFTSRPTTVTQICDTFFSNRDVQKIEVSGM
ncbi:nucleoside-triphosphatase [Candidatus Uabimicrobium amorphum]|uniref:AAA+ ATPase domain-containing protein n=1 Tax=Uabimicrobium amorphum TaxID=2596890 RepID=A0A5S9F537_UABAM|nr:nucleoside-triphosphatase [Candidatus Uabimicrobium amorphum]BBM85891.1 hypothetical protein UABAM_04273 [Candidatus Uabimicrobium amorphum]